MNIIDILHNCELFSEVGAAGFQRLAAIARLCHFRKGQIIFRENEPCPGVFVVGQGQVRVFKTASGGKEHILHIVGPGGTFAEVAAIGGFPLPASAAAIKKTTCVLLPLERFRLALAEDHALCLGMMASMTVWVRRLVTLMEDVTLRDAAGRLARFLLDLAKKAPEKGSGPIDRNGPPGASHQLDLTPFPASADGIVKLPGMKRYVANHLNLTGETFSRTLRRMVEAGLIAEVDKDQVRLLQPKKLRLVAEGMFPQL